MWGWTVGQRGRIRAVSSCEEYCRLVGTSFSVFELEKLVRGYPFQGGSTHHLLAMLRRHFSGLSLLRIRTIAFKVWREMYREHAYAVMYDAMPVWYVTGAQISRWQLDYGRSVDMYIELRDPTSLAARRGVQPTRLFEAM
jgi:hypothetical protein